MSDKKILIVDDEPNIVLALKTLLDDQKYVIEYCYDGTSAIEYLHYSKPDLVLLDVMMPGIDGYSVAKYIRNEPSLDHTNIIFLTAKGTKEDKMEGYDSGAEYYIVKPFDNEDVLSKVNELLKLPD